MKLFRKTALFLLLIFAAMSIQAQNLQQYIPSDADFVFSMNLANLDKKISFDKLKEYDFYKEMMKEMDRDMSRNDEELAKMIKSPTSVGLDVMSESYIFGKVSEEASLFGFLFNISDNSKFTKFFKEAVVSKNDGGVMSKSGKFQTYADNDVTLPWGNNVGILVGGEMNRYQEEGSVRENLVSAFTKSVLNSTPRNSILSNKRYSSATSKTESDFRFWMSYEWFMNMQTRGANMAGAAGIMNAAKEMYKDSDYLMDLNFNDGQIVMDGKMFSNNKTLDQLKKMSTGELNKDFFKYLPKENMLGYFSFAVNMKDYADGIFEMLNPMMVESGMTRKDLEDMAIQNLTEMGIEMDRKGLYEIIKGDMILAVTGMREFTIKKTQYDEDFNRVEVEAQQNLPEFSLMMSYGRDADLKKIVQMGIDAGALSKVNSTAWKIAVPVPDVPMDFFLVMRDGIMFLTNNNDLADGKLANGYGKGARMTKDQQKLMNDNSGVFYWDIPMTLSAFAEYAKSEGMLDKMTTKLVNVSKQSLESIVMKTDKTVKNSFNSEFSFNFVNKRMNSLDQLFSYINELFLTTQSGGGM